MKVKELLQVANYLKHNVKNEEFNISKWKCGTTACAIGHTAHLFKQNGFKMIRPHNNDMQVPWYQGHVSYCALTEFFELSEPMTMYLFSPVYYKSFSEWGNKSIVINRILDTCFLYVLSILYNEYYRLGLNYETTKKSS